MVLHDETLDRTTDLSGPVADVTAAQLAAADAAAKSPHRDEFGQQKVSED